MDKVSIITATYNTEMFVVETIESILSQTYPYWELLITDDCSTDNTWRLLNEIAKKDNRISLFKLSVNSGPAAARNNSLREASGRYIAFCDSDDKWVPTKLEKQIDFMKRNGLTLSYTSYDVISEQGISLGEISAPSVVNYQLMLRNNYIGCLTAMYDCSQIGKIDMPEIRKRQDWALWLKILKKTPFAMGIQENLAVYRDRSKSVSSNKLKLLKYNWKIYRDIEHFSLPKSSLLFVRFLFYYLKKRL